MLSSLRSRVLIFFITLVLAALIILTFTTYLVVRAGVSESARDSLADITASNGMTLSNWIKDRTRMVSAVSAAGLENVHEAMLQLERSGGFDEAYTGFSDKREVSSHDSSGEGSSYDPTHRPWYMEAVHAGKPVITAPYKDFSSQKLVITFANPIVLASGVTAVVAADISLDGINDVLRDIHPTPSSFAFIVDKKGSLIAINKAGMVLKPATALAPDLTGEMLSHLVPRSGRSVDIGGREVWLSGVPVTGTDWKFVVALDQQEVTGILDKIVLSSCGISALIIAVTILLVVAFMSVAFRRLSGIQAAMEKVSSSDGDLTGRLPADGHDEISSIASAFNRFAEKICVLLHQVQESSQAVALSASEISQGNGDLSRRTEESAASLEETAAALAQLSSTVNLTSESASAARDMASEAKSVADRGGEAVNDVVSTMSRISLASERIRDINRVINDIAFQTNILALNAAVEAARAGEHGRGFAVVASEVRSLSQRSAQAAKEISVLIDESVSEIAVGALLAENAGGTMSKIVDNATSISRILQDIALASSEQSAGLTQINAAIGQLEGGTQQNASLVQQATVASESLKKSARKLADTTGQFRTE